MSELSARSGLPVATIKYYLREGLLPAGLPTAATRSAYDESHVRRLRLVRSLIEVGGLRLDAVREVLAAVDDPGLSWHEAVGSAHRRLAPTHPQPPPSATARAAVAALAARRGWELSEHNPHHTALASALTALEQLDHPISEEMLERYATSLEDIAVAELAAMSTDRQAATEHAVIGTLLVEPVLITLRRIAQENASRRTRRS